MRYDESICFSPDPAEQLNDKAFSIDKSLYLFAYYEPKPYLPAESFRSRFITAVINLYGLFWDCGPFVPRLLETPDSILLSDWKRIHEDFHWLRSAVGAFRSIFCHNHSDMFPLNAENYTVVQTWIKTEGAISLEMEDLEEEHWKKLLQVLTDEADRVAKDLSQSLERLALTTDVPRRTRAIAWWRESIAGHYLRNPDYLLNAMASMYLLYLMNTGAAAGSAPNLRRQTVDWLVSVCGVTDKNKWWDRWLDKPLSDARHSKAYHTLSDWPNQWAARCGCPPAECDSAPMPAGDFLRILASDVDLFATAPHLGYPGTI